MTSPEVASPVRLTVLALALSACAPGQRVGALTVATVALATCDWRQTSALSDEGRWDVRAPDGNLYVERDPLLGMRPSPGTLAAGWFAGSAAMVAVGASPLPTWLKYATIGAVAAFEAVEVARVSPAAGVCGR